MSFLLVSFWLVGRLEGTLFSITEDLQEGCDLASTSTLGTTTKVSSIRASGIPDIAPGSFSRNVDTEKSHGDISLWGRITELRGSINNIDEQPCSDGETGGGFKSCVPSVLRDIEDSNRISRGAQMLEATLREIGRRANNADGGDPCSGTEGHLYKCLRVHINELMTPHKTAHNNQKENMLKKLLCKADTEVIHTEKAKPKSLLAESLGKQLQRQIKQEMDSKQSLKWNQAVVLRGFQEIFGAIKCHERELKDIPQSGDKIVFWVKLRTDIEKVVFGALNYMYQLKMINQDQMEDFLKEPGVIEILGTHLHNVYQLAEVTEFEPTVDFLASMKNLTWYMHDSLTSLDKSIQKVLIHAVLSTTCQSFMKYCTLEDIAVSDRFKEIARIHTKEEFSGNFNEVENKQALIKHFCTLFKNSAEFYQTGPDTHEGAFFSAKPWRSCKKLIKHGHKNLFSHREISSGSQMTSYLINLYILHYTINFWSPEIQQELEKVVKKSLNFLKNVEVSKHALYSNKKTETFFDFDKGLCKLAHCIPQK